MYSCIHEAPTPKKKREIKQDTRGEKSSRTEKEEQHTNLPYLYAEEQSREKEFTMRSVAMRSLLSFLSLPFVTFPENTGKKNSSVSFFLLKLLFLCSSLSTRYVV